MCCYNNNKVIFLLLLLLIQIIINQNDGFGKKKVETPLSFGNTNASKQSSSGVGKEAKKPSFGFGFASEKKEPLVNQNDGFGKKKVEKR